MQAIASPQNIVGSKLTQRIDALRHGKEVGLIDK
jgi:hypothetical protein